MGFLKILLKGNSADGIREAMKFTYKKETRHKFLYDIAPEIHQKGLIVALQSRYRTFGIEQPLEMITNEISIFLMIPSQQTAIDALCEYVVYKEMPIDAKTDGLKRVLNETLKSEVQSLWHSTAYVASSVPEYIEWAKLIEDSLITKLEKQYYHNEEEKEKEEKEEKVIINNTPIVIPEKLYSENIDGVYIFKYINNEKGQNIKYEYWNSDEKLLHYITYEYDEWGKVICECKYSSNGILEKKIPMKYEGELLIERGDESVYKYNNYGQKIEQVIKLFDLSTQTMLFEYDSSGRIIKKKIPHKIGNLGGWYTSTIYEYNSKSQLIKSYDLDENEAVTSSSKYEYNEDGLLTNEYLFSNDKHILYQDVYEYDSMRLLIFKYHISFSRIGKLFHRSIVTK